MTTPLFSVTLTCQAPKRESVSLRGYHAEAHETAEHTHLVLVLRPIHVLSCPHATQATFRSKTWLTARPTITVQFLVRGHSGATYTTSGRTTTTSGIPWEISMAHGIDPRRPCCLSLYHSPMLKYRRYAEACLLLHSHSRYLLLPFSA